MKQNYVLVSPKWLKITLASFAVLVIGLIIGIIVVKNNNPIIDPDLTLSEQLANFNQNDIDQGIKLFQAYIDTATPEEKAELYTKRAHWVVGLDYDKAHSGQAISDAIAADDILQDANSAGVVINTANYYGKSDVASKYVDKIIERQKATGIDINTDTEGEG